MDKTTRSKHDPNISTYVITMKETNTSDHISSRLKKILPGLSFNEISRIQETTVVSGNDNMVVSSVPVIHLLTRTDIR